MTTTVLGTDILLFVVLGGIIPVIFWLKFWLKEETHQEPRGIIFGTFLAGMGAVILAIPLEHVVSVYFPHLTLLSLGLWAFIEEFLKFGAAYIIAIRTRFVDEPIDATIYLITAALGFAALENMIFIFTPLSLGNIAEGFTTLNLRFIGATLLHIISSGAIGIFIGLAFYKNKHLKKIYFIIGLLIATILHTAFNSFIIRSEGYLFEIFGMVWLGLIGVIVILEKIKTIKKIS